MFQISRDILNAAVNASIQCNKHTVATIQSEVYFIFHIINSSKKAASKSVDNEIVSCSPE